MDNGQEKLNMASFKKALTESICGKIYKDAEQLGLVLKMLIFL